jgi:ribonucleoside-triphosphate reductase
VCWSDVPFETVVIDGKTLDVNLETAVEQLDRYKMLMDNWCQQNVSATISYSVDEVEQIIDWLLTNWDSYVGVSFLFRADPTKTAKDLGYLYLPQEVVTKEAYDEYVAKIQPIILDEANDIDAVVEDDCSSGACPVR